MTLTGALTRTLRVKKCAVEDCGQKFMPKSPWAKVCSPSCAVVFTAAERKRLDAKQTRERKAALKTKRDYIKEAQVAFNAYIRERDKDQPCICCGRTSEKQYLTGTNWDCGHYRSTGSAPHLRFDENNAHRQLTFCNRDRAGNAVEYRIGLIRRIGLEAVEALEADNEPRKFTVGDLKAIKATYKQKLKELKEKA